MNDNKLPKKVTIMGAARSGIAAAKFLCDCGVPIFISDACENQKLDAVLAENGLSHVPHEAGAHSDKVLQCDVIVLSPGIPSDIAILKQAREKHIPVWSEMELGFRFSKAPFLAVTGSSGKSTTVSLLGEIMKAAGYQTVVAGNIGIPVIAQISPMRSDGYVVAEVSSFQLENIDLFKPRVAAIINLMKNHLDRYPGEEEYYGAKLQIARNLDKGCHLVVNACDSRLYPWAMEQRSRTSVVFFGRNERGFQSVWYENGLVKGNSDGIEKTLFAAADMKLSGRHNVDNAAAAAAVALSVGVPADAIARGVCSFEGLPHRLQFVGEHAGVRYYNDSKSTTAQSVQIAVTAFTGPVHLIAGGRDKGCDFSIVKEALGRCAKDVFLIGEAARRMHDQWKEIVPITILPTLEDAVQAAKRSASSGDVVVFSPGCSSFDMFKNYEHRGEVFTSIVHNLVP